jgi:beta-glucosidase
VIAPVLTLLLQQSSLEARVDAILQKMTLEEKISLCHGDSKFTTNAIPRLGIPRRWMSDGPHGVREDVGPDTWNPAGRTDDFSTYMPVNICLAASWDPALANAYGSTIGEEARARGKHIMLGPGVNIMRTPLNGRNFEYFGEDPWLTSRLAVGYIQGEQSQGVASCVKHFAANNQETARNSVNVEMDERTLREIYLPAFHAAVTEGSVWTVMTAYNKFRDAYCSENEYLNDTILKGEWGFKGLVMSDWAGVHSTDGAVRHGMDLEMGTNRAYDDFYLAKPFREGVKNGTYPLALLDDKVRRNLRVMIASGALDYTTKGALNSADHQATARKVAESGMVLLKNENSLLPLQPAKIKTIAVIGDNAIHLHGHGGGSAGIKAFYEVSPLQGLINRVGGNVNLTFSQGYKQPEFRRGAADAAGVRATNAAAGALDPQLVDRAVRAAKAADIVIFVGGLYHGRGADDEGSDRKDLKLPFGQDELIKKVVAANKHTVVVLLSGAPIEMDPWLAKTPAVLQAWYPGMEGGNAIASILFGDVNPSGKLPCSFPKKLADSPAHALNAYPGVDGTETYKEGLFVGYRWFDTKAIEPLFPFGFGLSYTTFGYSNTVEKNGHMLVDVKNTGARDGAEVVQLYVEPVKPSVERPLKELKGFAKVILKAGETKTVEIALDPHAFAFYDPAKKAWVAEAGEYRLQVGASSRDIRGTVTMRRDKTEVVP